MEEKVLTREEMKEKALEIMEELDIYKPYIEEFKDKNDVCFFERYAGFWAWQEEDVLKKMKELEEEFGFLVYAITHEYTSFGECWSFIYVSQYEEEQEWCLQECGGNTYIVPAYVWNKSYEEMSEPGDISISAMMGGITRVG